MPPHAVCETKSRMPSVLLSPAWFGFLSRPAGKAVYFFFIAIYYIGAGKRRLTWPWDDNFSFRRNLPFLAGTCKRRARRLELTGMFRSDLLVSMASVPTDYVLLLAYYV